MKPIRFSVVVVITILILMSVPIAMADENEETVIQIELGYWTNGNWEPLTVPSQSDVRIIDPWSGRIIHQETTNGTIIQVSLDNSEPIRPEIRSRNNTTYFGYLPTIIPNPSEITVIRANISTTFEFNSSEINSWKYFGKESLEWILRDGPVTLPEGEGWIETNYTDENGVNTRNLLSVNCENSVSLDCGLGDKWPPTQGTLRIMAQDSGWEGAILAQHSPSGWEDLFFVSGTLDHHLPRIESGEWHLSRLIDGMPETQPHSFDDGLFESLDAWLSSSPISVVLPDSVTELDFEEENPNYQFAQFAEWSANIRLPTHVGHPMFPSSNLGIMFQIDKFIGNWDGFVNVSESEKFSERLESLGWRDAGNSGCCILNGENMVATETIYPSGAHINPATGSVFSDGFSWGWDETGNLIGNSSDSDIQILKIPFRGDIRDSANLTIDLSQEWELRHSPQSEIILSHGESIFVNRSALTVTGEVVLNIEKNDPPIPSISSVGATESYVILGGNPSLNLSCEDSVQENTEERWRMTDKRGFSLIEGKYLNFSTDAEIFSEGDQIQIIGECIDSHGAIGSIERNLILDGTAPEWDIILLEDHPQYWAQINHSMSSLDVSVNATSTLIIDITAVDNNGEKVSIILTSNRSQGWIRESDDRLFFAEFWPQTDNINGMHMSIEERHKERNLAIRWVHLSISDSVGNSVETNWSFTSLDLGPPIPRPALLVDGEIFGTENLANTSSIIEIDVNSSFDDISAIDSVLWTAELNGIPLFENQSWLQVSRFSIPPLDLGRHDLVVSGIDLAGNIGHHSMIIEIHPNSKPSLSIGDIMVPTGVLSGQPGEITVVVFNHGSIATNANVCIENECEEILVIGASLDGIGMSSTTLSFDSLPPGRTPVTVNWSVDGEPNSTDSTTPSIEPAWRENVRFIIKIILIAYCLGTLFDRRFGST